MDAKTSAILAIVNAQATAALRGIEIGSALALLNVNDCVITILSDTLIPIDRTPKID